jgi:hypothetical protein
MSGKQSIEKPYTTLFNIQGDLLKYGKFMTGTRYAKSYPLSLEKLREEAEQGCIGACTGHVIRLQCRSLFPG